MFASREVVTLLAEPAFRRVWALGVATGIARWIETLAVGVYTYEATNSAFIVALMTFLRMLPLAFLGPVVGALIDRTGHKRVLLAGLLAMFTTAAVLTTLAWSSSSLRLCRSQPLSIGPGQTALTRTFGARRRAKDLVNVFNAPLLAQ